ncbi:hypothetical protein DFP72DRAFT_895751 [Ephemerocybe angulata]|uniref:Uncharacterized protein n=1 Tax=Ephemerocybe angulata TaxID=980116 RepID=A0A8H6M8G6_9AGAR|nr:hypothetical protein DFP72DRAFT_895751 [Tulosesus angulatus]
MPPLILPNPQSGLSPLETFLLRMSDTEADGIMAHFEIPILLKLSKLNRRLRCWLDWYAYSAWNSLTFASIYVGRPHTLLSLMDGKDAMFYGEAILRFLLRCGDKECPLDVCTTLNKFYLLHRFLLDEGYSLTCKGRNPSPVRVAWMQVSMHERIGNILHDAGAAHDDWSLTADQSWSPEDHLGYKFRFSKDGPGGGTLSINLHLIRCEPYRHVMGSSLSTLTCYMTRDRCVAPFAESAFVLGHAYSLRNRRLLTDNTSTTEQEITSARKSWRFNILTSRQKTKVTIPATEIGARYLGDSSCWVLLRKREGCVPDPLVTRESYRGPTFEVMDWKDVEDEEGSFLTIGEPTIWSSRYFYALRTRGT